MQTELLAPAKDKETAFAAIDCGADAVYIGGPAFGARSKAGNTINDIKEIVDYAHRFYVRIYVTVNTVLSNSELQEAVNMIQELYDIGVDGIIIQDMGILELAINGKLPPIPIHISTQCDNRDIEKVKFFERVGVPRVVLARELSLDKIRDIRSNTKVELECFIHGALCVSYSGLCYLSEHIGGRSANRGECAQPCRKKYTLVDDFGNVIAENKHLLSLKDFNASNYLKEMVDIGVNSFKIEGRLKDINYVKSVVLYYRRLLNNLSDKTSSGKVFTDISPDITKTFNRGYTDYFLKERGKCFNFGIPKGQFVGKVTKIGRDFFEIDSLDTINPQDGLCLGNDFGCLVNKVEDNRIYPNRMPEIKKGDFVYRNKDAKYEKYINNAKITRKIGVDLCVVDNRIILTDKDDNMISLDFPSKIRSHNPARMNETFRTQFSKTGESDFYIDRVNISGHIPFMPISVINELRRKGLSLLMQERIKNYPKEIQKELNYSEFYKSEYDYRANVYNDSAREFYSKCNCEIVGDNKPIELMRTKHCLKYALNMCRSEKKLFLVDEKGAKYPLKFDCKNCEMVILS